MDDFWETRFRELDALIERLERDTSAWDAARELATESLRRLESSRYPRGEPWAEAAKEHFAEAVALADQHNRGEFADSIRKARAEMPRRMA